MFLDTKVKFLPIFNIILKKILNFSMYLPIFVKNMEIFENS